MKKILIIILFILIITPGCSKDKETDITFKEINCTEMNELVSDGAILIDVRTEEEYNTGHIKGAINISSTDIMDNIESKISNKDAKIIVYCKSGKRSEEVARKLSEKGYKNIYDLGSINNCLAENTLNSN